MADESPVVDDSEMRAVFCRECRPEEDPCTWNGHTVQSRARGSMCADNLVLAMAPFIGAGGIE
jgi:hypothetical protein